MIQKSLFFRSGLPCFVENATVSSLISLQIIPEKMVDNMTMDYMSFITRLKNSHKDGDESVVTKSPPGNSSEQGSFNASTKLSPPREPREVSLYIIACIGITMSMICLFITMTSICYFRRLRKFRRNQILVHIVLQ